MATVKVHYEIGEQRTTEGVLELSDDEAHRFLAAKSGAERRAAVRELVWRHAAEQDDWADNETFIVSRQPDSPGADDEG